MDDRRDGNLTREDPRRRLTVQVDYAPDPARCREAIVFLLTRRARNRPSPDDNARSADRAGSGA